MIAREPTLMTLVRAIAVGDSTLAMRMLTASPALATSRLEHGATRLESVEFYLDEINHYVYAGDTALHVAAASYQPDDARALLERGADVGARNRRGAQPLHYAADGSPGSAHWNPTAQSATIAYLIEAGADPNAIDASGVTPLHRAVRTRCATAVGALLDGGADALAQNGKGSTPIELATRNTGRGGTGSPESKAQQAEIIQLLERHGATA